jgi:hypothetical protein
MAKNQSEMIPKHSLLEAALVVALAFDVQHAALAGARDEIRFERRGKIELGILDGVGTEHAARADLLQKVGHCHAQQRQHDVRLGACQRPKCPVGGDHTQRPSTPHAMRFVAHTRRIQQVATRGGRRRSPTPELQPRLSACGSSQH